jgi:hypothetical protein
MGGRGGNYRRHHHRGKPPVSDPWKCYRCGRGFVHARFLVTHLIELHGEGAR